MDSPLSSSDSSFNSDSNSSPLHSHSDLNSSSDHFESHWSSYFDSDSDTSSSDDDSHTHEAEGPQILSEDNLSRVHIAPFSDSDHCIHYDLPHKEATSLYYPTEANNYLQNTLKKELLPILKKAHKEVQELEATTRKYIQTQSQSCRSAVADPEYLASSHLMFFIEEATNRFFSETAKKLENLCKDNDLQQKIHYERWLSKVGYYFFRTKEEFLQSNKVERLMKSLAVPKAVFQEVHQCLICIDKKPEVAFQYNADDLEHMVPCTCTNINMCLDCALSTYWVTTRETGISFSKCPFCKGDFKVENIIKAKPILPPPQPIIITNTNTTNNNNANTANNNVHENNDSKTEKDALDNSRRYPKRQRKK